MKNAGAPERPQGQSGRENTLHQGSTPAPGSLVQRLRRAYVVGQPGYEAADEIERLEIRLGLSQRAHKYAEEEVERLTRERDEAEKIAESLQNKWANRPLDHPSGDALMVENDRLTDERNAFERNMIAVSAERDEAHRLMIDATEKGSAFQAERDRLAAELAAYKTAEPEATKHLYAVIAERDRLIDIEEQYHAFERSKGAECERLRAALERIVNGYDDGPMGSASMVRIAREALRPTAASQSDSEPQVPSEPR